MRMGKDETSLSHFYAPWLNVSRAVLAVASKLARLGGAWFVGVFVFLCFDRLKRLNKDARRFRT